MYFRLAFRNIFRNRTRSLITLGAIAFGYISLVLAGGFMEDVFLRMRESYIRSHLGHIQVYKKGFIEKGVARPFDFMISDPVAVSSKILSIDLVRSVTPRLEFSGLLSTGDTTVSFIGQGIDAEGEKEISTMVLIEKGDNLEPGDAYDIIVGKGLADALSAKVADPLIIVSNTKGGAINALDVNVKGVFFTSSKTFDDHAIRLPITAAQKLLHTNDVQTLVVLLERTEDTDAAVEKLRDLFIKEGLDLELKPWHELADFYTKTVTLYKRQFTVIQLIIAVIMTLSIFNTMNMAVLERIGEIGTMMAMGTRRGGVVILFLLEGAVLGVIGGLSGAIGGAVLASAISYVGIPMPPPPGATMSWTAGIIIVPKLFAFTFLLAIISTVVSSCYPAIKASRLEIAEALRHNI